MIQLVQADDGEEGSCIASDEFLNRIKIIIILSYKSYSGLVWSDIVLLELSHFVAS